MRLILSLLLLTVLAVASPAARLEIDKKHWQANEAPGFCGWMALKTLLLHYGDTELAKKVIDDEKRLGGQTIHAQFSPSGGWREAMAAVGDCTPEKMKERLDLYKLKYKMQYPSKEKNTDILYEAVDKQYGAIISTEKGDHAVLLVNVTKEKKNWTYADGSSEESATIEWIDSNDVRKYQSGKTKELKTVRTSLNWFVNYSWDGWAVIVYPRKLPTDTPPVPKEDTRPILPGLAPEDRTESTGTKPEVENKLPLPTYLPPITAPSRKKNKG